MLIEAKGRDPDPRANLQTQLGVAASACAASFGAERAAYRSATLAASTSPRRIAVNIETLRLVGPNPNAATSVKG